MLAIAAAWVREHVLVFRINPVRPRVIRGHRAGGPCACERVWVCCWCQMNSHDRCTRIESGREQGLYGPGLTWPPRAAVFLADRLCHARCACPKCARSRPAAAPQLRPEQQLNLFEVTP